MAPKGVISCPVKDLSLGLTPRRGDALLRPEFGMITNQPDLI
ncbi:MAG: hypothetical protein ACREPR_10485 [Brasilonema sp.]